MSRRPAVLRTTALAAAALLTLTACSTGPTSDAEGGDTASGTDDTGQGQGTAAADDGSAAGGEDTGTFPVTVDHAFGSTEITADPQRVVTVGWTDHEVMAALGEVPVGAVTINWGGNEAGSTDWFDEAVTELGHDPADITRYDDSDGIPVDEIAAMEPDLIIGTNSGMSEEDYDRLSRIAPTVAYPETAWATPWRESVELVGQAIGRPEQAQEAIAETEAEFESAREEFPQLEGTSFAWGWFSPTDTSTIGLYNVIDLRPQFLTELGMVNAPVVEEMSGEENFSANLSAEQADTLDADVFIFYTDGGFTADKLLEDPLLSQIPAMASGAYVEADEPQEVVGMSSPTPLSIPVAIDRFVPQVAEAAATAAEADAR
ncbi:iron-siderophore ABC transporter substrate-binding protein [Ornithinimicrobium kibberense]|uniref:Iron-siderophore ABC transporter substrate-binding protein n=2 Tax=Ornithinimicrobium kibberense TaxID=282060 RepID=A0ABV5UZ80_9MICO|nr:iron-siderophore ABC transporter substrate-binding protein [Ornithinimicrobium kibberense]